MSMLTPLLTAHPTAVRGALARLQNWLCVGVVAVRLTIVVGLNTYPLAWQFKLGHHSETK
jgi:NADPH-dependent curcumin reductase CurA